MRLTYFNIINNISVFFRGSAKSSGTSQKTAIDDIRLAMLNALDGTGEQQLPRLATRIRFASDLQGLWNLRAELMLALANMNGETSARQQLEKITDMFRALAWCGLDPKPKS